MSLRRPILKSLPTGESQPGIPSFRGGHVHFPPSPEMSATYFVHSARAYDRSAIIVSPNVCSLPKRHCPDRTYVLTDGIGGALLKSVKTKDMQDSDSDPDETPCAEHDQDAVRMDYFSIPSTASMPEMAWPELDDSDEIIPPPSNIDSNCGHSQMPLHDTSVYDTHARGTSEPHERVQAQATLSFPRPHPPPVHRQRNVSMHDLQRQDGPDTFSGGESSHAQITRSCRPRRESSFTADLPPDSGCLGGF